MVDVLLGLQWGDEGKGKVVDYLAPNYHIVARFQGGPNAGHTLYVNNEKVVLHTIPSGIFHKGITNVIGNGVVIDPTTLQKEIKTVNAAGVDVKDNLLVSRKAHLIMPTHKMLDAASEQAKGKQKIGSTLKGIGPAYMDKTGRNGLRVGDTEADNFIKKYTALKEKHLRLLASYDYEFDLTDLEKEWLASIDKLRELKFIDSEFYINEQIKAGKKVLAEGAQGSMLDIEFGTYPFVTSSNTLTSGACQGLGISPSKIGEVIGISKAYCTRVGGGPFPTELENEAGQQLRDLGGEYGATTGRPRRCGWIDLPALRYAIMLNGVTQLVITKADVLNEFETLEACNTYKVNGEETRNFPYSIDSNKLKPIYTAVKGWNCTIDHTNNELPEALDNYLKYLETELKVPVKLLSVGPKREELIVL
ncbi:UNVERIFIED_CONTAM: hypothetical protein GTU68_004977 [Idotea baltica]|nr:hypothetical protein [Idotea baltica]